MIRRSDFVIGKKYLFKCSIPSGVCTCIAYTSDKYPVFEYSGISGIRVRKVITEEIFAYVTEYKEPKKGVVWVNIYRDGCISYRNLEAANQYSSGRIACIEVPWVEGQGLEKKCGCNNKPDNRCSCK